MAAMQWELEFSTAEAQRSADKFVDSFIRRMDKAQTTVAKNMAKRLQGEIAGFDMWGAPIFKQKNPLEEKVKSFKASISRAMKQAGLDVRMVASEMDKLDALLSRGDKTGVSRQFSNIRQSVAQLRKDRQMEERANNDEKKRAEQKRQEDERKIESDRQDRERKKQDEAQRNSDMSDTIFDKRALALQKISDAESLSAQQKKDLEQEAYDRYAQLEKDKTLITEHELDVRSKAINSLISKEIEGMSKANQKAKADADAVKALADTKASSPLTGLGISIPANTIEEFSRLESAGKKAINNINKEWRKSGPEARKALMSLMGDVRQMLESGSDTADIEAMVGERILGIKEIEKESKEANKKITDDSKKEADRQRKVDETLQVRRSEIIARITKDTEISEQQKSDLKERVASEYEKLEQGMTQATAREVNARAALVNSGIQSELNVLKDAARKADNARSAKAAGNARMMTYIYQGQQLIEDASYAGFRGAANNLAFMAQSLGGPAGIAALVGIAAYQGYQLSTGLNQAKDEAEELSDALKNAADSMQTMSEMRSQIIKGASELDFPLDPDFLDQMEAKLTQMQRGFRGRFGMDPQDFRLDSEELESKLAELEKRIKDLNNEFSAVPYTYAGEQLGADILSLTEDSIRQYAQSLIDNPMGAGHYLTPEEQVKFIQGWVDRVKEARTEIARMESQYRGLLDLLGNVDAINKQSAAIQELTGQINALKGAAESLGSSSQSLKRLEKISGPLEGLAGGSFAERYFKFRNEEIQQQWDAEVDKAERDTERILKKFEDIRKANMEVLAGAMKNGDQAAVAKAGEDVVKTEQELADALKRRADELDSTRSYYEFRQDMVKQEEEAHKEITESLKEAESVLERQVEQSKQLLSNDMKRLQTIREQALLSQQSFGIGQLDGGKTIVGMRMEKANEQLEHYFSVLKNQQSFLDQFLPSGFQQHNQGVLDNQLKMLLKANEQIALNQTDALTQKQLDSMKGTAQGFMSKGEAAAAKGEFELADKHFENARKFYEQAQQLLQGEIGKGSINRAGDILKMIEELQVQVEKTFQVQEQAAQQAVTNDQQHLQTLQHEMQKLSSIDLVNITSVERIAQIRKELEASLALAQAISNVQFGASSPIGMGDPGAPNIQGKAVGGPVSYGTPYWVGEKGPELFIPPSSGMILDHLRSQAAVTGSGLPAYLPSTRTQGTASGGNTFNIGEVNVTQPNGMTFEEAQKRTAFAAFSGKYRKG